MDFRNLEDGYLETVVSLLNNRPRKCLGLKSPHEVFCCTWLCNIDATQTKRNQQDALPTFLLASFALAKLEAVGQALAQFTCHFFRPPHPLASLPSSKLEAGGKTLTLFTCSFFRSPCPTF